MLLNSLSLNLSWSSFFEAFSCPQRLSLSSNDSFARVFTRILEFPSTSGLNVQLIYSASLRLRSLATLSSSACLFKKSFGFGFSGSLTGSSIFTTTSDLARLSTASFSDLEQIAGLKLCRDFSLLCSISRFRYSDLSFWIS